MRTPKSLHRRHRFTPDIAQHAVWRYHRFSLSFRDVEGLLAQRGVTISYRTVRRRYTKFGPVFRYCCQPGQELRGFAGAEHEPRGFELQSLGDGNDDSRAQAVAVLDLLNDRLGRARLRGEILLSPGAVLARSSQTGGQRLAETRRVYAT